MTHRHRPALAALGLALALVLTAALLGGTASADTEPALHPPVITILHSSPADAHGYVFVAPKRTTATTGQQGPEIVDDQGRPVWFDSLTGGDQALDFRVQRYRGKPVLTWWQGQSHTGAGHGEGEGVIADTSYHVIATVHAGNGLDEDMHEFVLTPDGHALITIYHAVPADLSSVGGPVDGQVFDGVVQEIDVKTGHVLFEWHSLDHVALSESHQPVPSSPSTTWDYFHINAVNLDQDGNLLISARHTWTIYKVDRHTGAVIWRLGGKKSDFKLGDGVEFAWQHNALPAGPQTIRIFDNESSGIPNRPHSRVIWVHLDTHDRTATLVRAFEHPDGLLAPSQGNAQALDNGDTFVGWGALGRVSEFSPDGVLLFDAQVPDGYDDYRAYRFEWEGDPATQPTATATAAGGSVSVHAIWNGATEVARWRVVSGGQVLATAPWNGLDTAISVPGSPAEVSVVALDERGRELGRSASVPVS